MPTRKRALFPALLLLCLLYAQGASAAVRIAAEGVAPFSLLESAVEDTTAWYDAETWLRRFPGAVEWRAEEKRLTYREGSHQWTLQAEPPYALRDGQPVDRAPATRILGGRLTVSEAFLLERASDFLGRNAAAERVHGTGMLRVVIDPGHGGPDSGARGTGTLAEKDAVLTLARDLSARLRRRGFDVRLTRQDDRFVDAATRAAVANHWEADLFLSLHASGLGRPQARGFEIFVPRPPAPGADPRSWAGGQVGRVEESRRWAETVRRSLGEALSTFNRGVRELPSPLLEALAAPACLAELANLAVPEEEGFLVKPQGRAALADALAGAVDAYFR
jgi:N-acetylmuramoyl-L-alanine amidase